VSRFARGHARETRRLLRFSGRSHDRGCITVNGVRLPGKVKRVYVSIAKVRGMGRGKNCRFLTRKGRLTGYRYCRRPVLLRARGTTRWRIAVKPDTSLPPGEYRAVVRAFDAVGNKERPKQHMFTLR